MNAILYGIEPNELNLKKGVELLAWVLVFPEGAAAVVAYGDMVLAGRETNFLKSLPKMAVSEREVSLDYPDAEKLIEWAKASQEVSVTISKTLQEAFPMKV